MEVHSTVTIFQTLRNAWDLNILEQHHIHHGQTARWNMSWETWERCSKHYTLIITTGRWPFKVFFISTEPRQRASWGTHQCSFYSSTDNTKLDCQNPQSTQTCFDTRKSEQTTNARNSWQNEGRQQSIREDCQCTDRWQSAMSTINSKQTNISIRSDTIHRHKDKR